MITLSEESESSNNGIEAGEMEEMLETLKREREELGKLKSTLVDTVKQKEDDVKAQKEKELENKGKVILTNFVKDSVDNKEKLVNEQVTLPSFSKEVEVKELIIQDNEDVGSRGE